MEAVGGSGSSEVENDLEMKLLRDRFRLSAISIAESQGSIQFVSLLLFLIFSLHFCTEKLWMIQVSNPRLRFAVSKNGMEVSKVVVACVADLAFKYTGKLYTYNFSSGTLN